jgi:aspartyl/asparaginyl-tRNA synthetase
MDTKCVVASVFGIEHIREAIPFPMAIKRVYT